MPDPASPVLRPFVPRLLGAAGERLARAVGLGREIVRGFALLDRSADGTDWSAEFQVDHAEGLFTLQVSPASGDRPAWFRTPHFAVAYGSQPRDPFQTPGSRRWLSTFRERLLALAAHPAGAAASVAALEAMTRLPAVVARRDEDFRLILSDVPGGPLGLLWLGFGCNQDCDFCYQGRDWPSPPIAVFEAWIDDMRTAGVRSFQLSGGEPTLRPELPTLVERAAREGGRVSLETNAIRLEEAAFRQALRTAGVGEIFVSLHTDDADLSDRITRTPGSHARTVAGLRGWLEDGGSAGVHCVVDRRHVARLPLHAAFLLREFVRPYRGQPGPAPLARVSFSFPTRYHDGALYTQQMVHLDEVREPLSEAVALLRREGVEVHALGASGFPLCALREAEQERGRLHPVGPGPHEMRRYAAACEGCDGRTVCLGVPLTYLEVHRESGLRPLPCPGSPPTPS